jgi:hypothetical protein
VVGVVPRKTIEKRVAIRTIGWKNPSFNLANPPLIIPSCLCVVLRITLPGITLSDFASRHAAEWFPISTDKLCYQSQFPPPSEVAIT